jgi:hypothetical protein
LLVGPLTTLRFLLNLTSYQKEKRNGGEKLRWNVIVGLSEGRGGLGYFSPVVLLFCFYDICRFILIVTQDFYSCKVGERCPHFRSLV